MLALSFLFPGAELEGHLNGQVTEGRYKFMGHLRALDSCRHEMTQQEINPLGEAIVTPLILPEWQVALKDHPDKEFAMYITAGIKQGFRLGYQRREGSHLQQASGNMSTPEPELVTNYLDHETSLGRMIRVKEGSKPTGKIHISPMGMIPKKNRPGKWRLIVDLSLPKGANVNHGISGAWSSLAYTTVDHLAEIILSLGQGVHMVKADIKEAYRMVPVLGLRKSFRE